MECKLEISRTSDDALLVSFQGEWKISNLRPDASVVKSELDSLFNGGTLRFSTDGLTGWDSSLLTFLLTLDRYCLKKSVHFDDSALPEGVKRLLALAVAVPERQGARKEFSKESFFARVGAEAISFGRSTKEIMTFIGEATIAFWHLMRGKGRIRLADLSLIIQDCGVGALPIVSLISLLVGLILAFVGAIQLMAFGAEIYVASLVGIAMVRVMGAVMAGIIMAGRTGAAFAAQLGTMQVNEEVDALKTLGISPMEFLVLPRMIALGLMMPLLCLYADLMGIVGGLIVGVGMLDLNVSEYYQQTITTVSINDLWIGLIQGAIFGVLVAVSGCLRGLQCGRSASAVGSAATSAVVTGIVSIIVATALVTIICNVLGV